MPNVRRPTRTSHPRTQREAMTEPHDLPAGLDLAARDAVRAGPGRRRQRAWASRVARPVVLHPCRTRHPDPCPRTRGAVVRGARLLPGAPVLGYGERGLPCSSTGSAQLRGPSAEPAAATTAGSAAAGIAAERRDRASRHGAGCSATRSLRRRPRPARRACGSAVLRERAACFPGGAVPERPFWPSTSLLENSVPDRAPGTGRSPRPRGVRRRLGDRRRG